MLQRGIQAAAPAQSVAWDVRRIEGPFCPVLDLLRPFGAAAQSRLSLSSPASGPQVTVGDAVRVVETSPRPPAFVILDWFGNDGSVHHVHVVPADASTLTAEWKAQVPLGAQLITIVTSAETLLQKDRPVQELAAAYLKDLQSALDQARSHDARVTADVMSIEVTRH